MVDDMNKSDTSLFEVIFSTTNDYAIVLNNDFSINRANEAFLNTFNLDGNGIANGSFFELCQRLGIHSINDFNQLDIEDSFIFCTNTEDGSELTWQIRRLYPNGYLVIGKYEDYKKILNKYFQLKTMINHMPCNVYWMDKDLTHIGCNQNVLDMLDIESDKYIGSTYEELSEWAHWPDGLGDSFKGDDKEVLETEKPKLNVEEPPFENSNGDKIYLLTSRVPLYDTSGKISGVAGISTDITKLKRALEKSETAKKRQAEFISNMSHDIKTPITGMIGLLRNMYESTEHEGSKKNIQDLLNTTSSLLSLLQDGIEAIKIRTGNMEVGYNPFNLHELLKNSCQLVKPSLSLKNIKLNFSYPSNCPDCFIGDQNHINRVFINLLGNSVKFTNKGVISFSVKIIRKVYDIYSLQIKVSDTGIGIPKDKLNFIFGEFTRLEPSHSGKYEGHGMGLFMVKNYLEKMGGEISVRSVRGVGSTFTVNISLKESMDQEISYNIIDFLEDSNFKKKIKLNVLLVEDTLTAGVMAKKMLEEYGAEVDWVKTGEDAILKYREENYDIILMDIGLPDTDGLTVTETIRDIPIKTNIPVKIVGLSAHAEKTHRSKCLKAGMDDMLSKPLSPAGAKNLLVNSRKCRRK